MAADTKIEWTDAVWNPIVGCSVCAAGCRFCYAMRMAHRLESMGVPHYAGTTKKVNGKVVWTGKVNVAPEHVLMQPLRWKKPRRIFVNSMSDLFHESVPDEVIDRIFSVMALCPQHTFQVLTKRPARMREYLSDTHRHDTIAARWNYRPDRPNLGNNRTAGLWPFPNVWLGTSVSTQADADANIPHLRDTPAAIRFVSFEPLLEPIDGIDLTGIDWAIPGGESGPGSRRYDFAWGLSIEYQAGDAGAASFHKQGGSNAYWCGKPWPMKDKKGGNPAEWPVPLKREWPGMSPDRANET